MERRRFIRQSALGLALAGAPGSLLAADLSPGSGLPVTEKGAPGTGSRGPDTRWVIHPDGSYDLEAGSCRLSGCYPSLGEHPVHPLSVEVNRSDHGGAITYRLGEGTLEIRLSGGGSGLTLDASLTGLGHAPRQLFPLAGGRLEGFDRFYKQGFGFGGPSGIIPIGDPEALRFDAEPVSKDVWSYDSYLVTGCIAPDGTTLATGALQHHQFLQRCTIHNRLRRFGLTDRRPDTWNTFLEAGFSTEGIPVPAPGRLDLPTLHFIAGGDAYGTFREFAGLIAASNGVKLDKAARYHYCSWYEHEFRFTREKLNGLLDGLQKIRPAIPLQTVQVDAGYCTLGDWLVPNHRWPGGMEAAFSAIRGAGYAAGIWIGPFMVNTTSNIYRDHRDWLLRDNEGRIIVEWERDTHGEGSVCILDSSHPGAFGYLREVFRTMRKWGATYYKTDFMDWGFQDSTRVRRHTPGKTSAAYFNEVVEMIREEIGPESFWLGCISPFASMVGYADAIRVSNDVSPGWNRAGTLNMFREMFFGQYFNNVLWQNDPDVFYLRDYDNRFTGEEKETLALWAGFTGGVVNTSDSIHLLPGEKLRFVRFLQPPSRPVTANMDRWADGWTGLVKATRELLNGDMGLLVANLTGESREVSVDPAKITGSGHWRCHRWYPGVIEDPGDGSPFTLELQPRQSALFYLSGSGGSPDPGITIHGEKKPGITPG